MAIAARESVAELIKKHKDVIWPDDPKFDKASRYDWRNYVPTRIQGVWANLGVEARTMVYIIAEDAANEAMARSDM